MNPMTNVKNIKKLCEEELRGRNRTSWHDQYRGSAWIFVGGLPYDLTEGDIICVFSQYGEPVNVNLVRDKDTGKSKGFCFICYEDQRSTDLAVDNFNGIKVLGRTIRVDHVENYKPPKSIKDERKEDTKDTSKATKEKVNEEKLSGEDGSLSDAVCEESRVLKKRKKKRKESESDSDGSVKRKRKKEQRVQKKKKNLEVDCSAGFEGERKKRKKQKSKSVDSDSSSSSSSTSASATSSDADESERKRKKKQHKREKLSKNRTIEDLKREAKLIHAELRRRQKMEDQERRARGGSDDERRRKRDAKTSR